MKKIEVSTVRQTADVEVLFINASLISKFINANNAAKALVEKSKATRCATPRYDTKVDENGEPILDKDGCIQSEPVLDEKGKQVFDYTSQRLDSNEVMMLHEEIAPLLQEMVDAFMA